MKHLYIESEWINALIRTFADLGINTRKITKGIAGFEDEKTTASYRLEVSAARKMWHRADELIQDPLLGFKVGTTQDFRAIGVLAPIIWHSPSVRSALNNITVFQTLISESGSYRINERDDGEEWVIHCEYIPVPNSVPVNAHQVLAVVVGTVGIIRAISNNAVKVKCLHLPQTLNAKLISKSLNCRVVNRAGNFAISFYAEHFDKPISGCDEYLYQINLTYAGELLRAKKAGVALIDSVKALIESNGFSNATIQNIELSLAMHQRTLQRNLLEQGTSFRRIKEEVLKERAGCLLLHSSVDIESVATSLGYSEPSAFHRAFKSWFGVTPRKYCKIHHYKT